MASTTSGARMSLEQQVSVWFQQWRDPIYRYLLAAGGDPTSAEEITQECFLRLFRSLHEGKPIENPQFWLYRVAHNLLVDYSRSPHFQNAMLPDEDETTSPGFFDESPGPERVAMDRQRLARVHDAMQSLTQTQRDCLYLRAEGFLNREISQILGIGMSSVADALRRAIKRLAKDRHD